MINLKATIERTDVGTYVRYSHDLVAYTEILQDFPKFVAIDYNKHDRMVGMEVIFISLSADLTL